MKTLVFFGSARKEGNTKTLLSAFLEGLGKDTENIVTLIDAYRTEIEPCKDCRYCWHKRGCSIKDYGQEIYRMVDEADVIVFASPVYFHSVSGPLKCIIDRMQMYWAQFMRKDKPSEITKKGAILLTGGAKSFPNQFLGSTLVLEGVLRDMNVECVGTVTAHTTDSQPVSESRETKKAAYELGVRIAAMRLDLLSPSENE